MTRIPFLILFFLFPLLLSAQVTTSPILPNQDGVVTITYDATQGTAGLKDYTGDVYAHTGVITSLSSSSSDWKYVLAPWTTNLPKAKMTRVSPNIYTLEITPDIKTFYGVPSGEAIQKMAFVFRSADRTKEGKATGGKDILIEVFDSQLNISITKPTDVSVIPKNSTMAFSSSTTVSANIQLLLNNSAITAVSGTQLDYSFSFSQPGDYWIKVVATNGTKNVADSVFVNVLEDVAIASLPAGAKKGISYLDSQTARLVLWAPDKSYVHVLGDFNQWLPSSAYRMKKDGDYFWIDLSNLTSGKEYPFQYLVDGTLKIADPYTEKILDPDHDKYITPQTYSGLTPYPTEKTEGIVSVLQTNQTPYQWQYTDYKATSPDTMVVYECLVRDFDQLHSFDGVITHLDYLKELGVNVLELMPVNEFEGNSSWGYNPSFYFAPDKYYGPKDQLKRLVDECHKRNIAVVTDLVLNHSFGQSPLVQLYFDGTNPTASNPWYNVQSNFTNPDAQWGYDFNHDRPATRELVDSICSFWMSQYKIDGFRFDFTKGFSNSIKDVSDTWGSKYDAARISNLERMASEIWKRKPSALVIFEHLSDNAEEKELANFGKGILLWGNMSGSTQEAAMGYNENGKSDFSGASYLNRTWNKPSLVAYMESHDEERMIYKCLTYGNGSGSYSVKTPSVAFQRAGLTAALFLTIPGPKMIWQFGELGYDISIDNNGRTGEKPIHWDYLSDYDRVALFKVYAKLLYLKKRYPIFSTSDFSLSLSGEIKTVKLNLNGESVFIVGNFGMSSVNASLDFQKSGLWYDYFGQKTINVGTSAFSMILEPGEYRLYSTQNFGEPIFTDVQNESVNQDRLIVYPNPTSQWIKIVSSDEIQRVSIYSVTGLKLKAFVPKNSFYLENQFYIGDLAQGVYFVQTVNKEGMRITRKIVKQP